MNRLGSIVFELSRDGVLRENWDFRSKLRFCVIVHQNTNEF